MECVFSARYEMSL